MPHQNGLNDTSFLGIRKYKHGFELHRPSNKGTKLLLKVIKAIIIIISCLRNKSAQCQHEFGLT